jgi:hypothetical protein
MAQSLQFDVTLAGTYGEIPSIRIESPGYRGAVLVGRGVACLFPTPAAEDGFYRREPATI